MNNRRQIPLSFRLDNDISFENFYVSGPAEMVVDALRAQAEGRGEKWLFLYAFTGASHLLQASCQWADRHQRSSRYLPLRELEHYPPTAVLEGVEEVDLLCLDDVDAVLGNADWEEALFNCYNRCLSSSTRVVISAHQSISELQVKLPDLRSRLHSFVAFRLPRLDDDALLAAFKLRAQLRGLAMSNGLAEYIFLRCERDFASLIAVLERLDKVSLVEKRRLTVPFVKAVMQW